MALNDRFGRELPASALNGEDWVLADANVAKRLQIMTSSGTTLGEYVNGKIYRGVLTGFNQAFVIDGKRRAELIAADPKSAEIIKPLAVGDDVRKWTINYRDRWIIVTKVGIDISHYPSVLAHLKQWRSKLETRWDKGNHWWELRPCDYYEVFEQPKMVFPDIAKTSRFTYVASTLHFHEHGISHSY